MQLPENTSAKIAEYLLEIRAIKLNPDQPFTWTSGWKSPIYSDNRVSLSHVNVRNYIKHALAALIEHHFADAQAIIGVATAGIAPGALVSDVLELPFGYVRSEAKKHGMGKQVEGDIVPKSKVVVVEDLISTGKSSLHAVEVLRSAGFDVCGLVSIFNYGFDVAKKVFEDANCKVYSLCTYDALIAEAARKGLVEPSQLDVLSKWRLQPDTWGTQA